MFSVLSIRSTSRSRRQESQALKDPPPSGCSLHPCRHSPSPFDRQKTNTKTRTPRVLRLFPRGRNANIKLREESVLMPGNRW